MIKVADNAGFCFGVRRATEKLDELRVSAKTGTRIYTLGDLIHNPAYLKRLENSGIRSVTPEQIRQIAEESNEERPVCLVIRTHGIPKDQEAMLLELEKRYPHFYHVDMTCPFVKRIQQIAQTQTDPETAFLLLGSDAHPEVKGILSYAQGYRAALSDEAEITNAVSDLLHRYTKIVIASQTTQNIAEWKKTQKKLENLYTNVIFFDTICNTTQKRQTEAVRLAQESDTMIIIGGRDSANTAQLFRVCREHCPNTYRIESADDLSGVTIYGKIAITAGASTPVDIIMEVYKKMSMDENLSFEEMLDGSLKSIHTGDVVNGIVTEITDKGIYLDFGTKVTGFLETEQIADDATSDTVSRMFKIGDEIKVFVIHVDDNSGVARVSKKKVDQQQNWYKLVEDYQQGTILEGTIDAAVKGGLIILLGDQRAFIPASHSGLPRDGKLEELIGTTQKVKLIDLDEHRKRALASIRVARSETRREQQQALWANLEVGRHYQGTVKNLTSYGAFVDIGGVDGMVHNSELSWKRIKHPSQVVSVGDVIDVYIKEIDPEKKRISLGYKTDEMDTFSVFAANHQVGEVVDAKITSIMPFGAFAEVYEGVEGLIHISRIAMEKVEKPQDKLSIGEVVKVKIVDIDREGRKVSLSIRALLEEAARAEAAEKAAQEKAEEEEKAAAEKAEEEKEKEEMAPYIVGSID